ncbi:hypothetical protein EVAR_33613_1 [Eumeta japonica]|uniref:Uncharacterized protein n=1 Tax=Eumeta variegata TaxID=151549 RepID=A0A4C1W924_EUMVA|nr:hypothetical protein EVAR_33613_1 [Eumeta japonica]
MGCSRCPDKLEAFFFSAQDKESIWDGVYRVIKDMEKTTRDVLLEDDSGQTCNIEEAFDNAWWPAIRNQLPAHKCPANLYGMVMGLPAGPGSRSSLRRKRV